MSNQDYPGLDVHAVAEVHRENKRLRKLFDDAGQGEYNVLALVEHYQDEMIKAQAENERLRAELSSERAESARLLASYRSESATVYKLREQIEELRYQVTTVASEAFGPFPVQTGEEACAAIEAGAFNLRAENERLRADRDTRIFDCQRLADAIRSYLDGEIDREQLEEEWRCP